MKGKLPFFVSPAEFNMIMVVVALLLDLFCKRDTITVRMYACPQETKSSASLREDGLT